MTKQELSAFLKPFTDEVELVIETPEGYWAVGHVRYEIDCADDGRIVLTQSNVARPFEKGDSCEKQRTSR